MAKLKHVEHRNMKRIIGSALLEFDENGVAEVQDEEYARAIVNGVSGFSFHKEENEEPIKDLDKDKEPTDEVVAGEEVSDQKSTDGESGADVGSEKKETKKRAK